MIALASSERVKFSIERYASILRTSTILFDIFKLDIVAMITWAVQEYVISFVVYTSYCRPQLPKMLEFVSRCKLCNISKTFTMHILQGQLQQQYQLESGCNSPSQASWEHFARGTLSSFQLANLSICKSLELLFYSKVDLLMITSYILSTSCLNKL
jgi:hypothetical protein